MIQIAIFSFFFFTFCKPNKPWTKIYISKDMERVDIDIDFITSTSFSLKSIYVRYTANEWAQFKHKKRK